MQSQVRKIFIWLNYFLVGLSMLFYIVWLQAPRTFLEGAAVGLVVYGSCYGFIRIGGYKFIRGIMLTALFCMVAFLIYTAWHILLMDPA